MRHTAFLKAAPYSNGRGPTGSVGPSCCRAWRTGRCPEKPGRWCRLPMHLREGAKAGVSRRQGLRGQRLDAGMLLAVEGRHRRRTAGLRGVVRAVKPQAEVVLM